ncbi:helix-turn-helix transcriptional regulator [Telmatospirillum sp. J64-1]|uniref:helix-turn-helix transcriptional regulator n=1 Tax=Telmatospirillum sp. J64-1 TaxID=2502183 RepID=UPI00115E8328|nr:helix-turn-helix transcriptional regulator [Telmatospirillum sp. J64-1]
MPFTPSQIATFRADQTCRINISIDSADYSARDKNTVYALDVEAVAGGVNVETVWYATHYDDGRDIKVEPRPDNADEIGKEMHAALMEREEKIIDAIRERVFIEEEGDPEEAADEAKAAEAQKDREEILADLRREDDLILAAKLRPRLKHLGITQKEFAAATAMSEKQVSQWSTGAAPTPAWVSLLLDCLEHLTPQGRAEVLETAMGRSRKG